MGLYSVTFMYTYEVIAASEDEAEDQAWGFFDEDRGTIKSREFGAVVEAIG